MDSGFDTLITSLPTKCKITFVEPIILNYPINGQIKILSCQQADYLGFDEIKGQHVLRVKCRQKQYTFYVKDPQGELDSIKESLAN